MFTRKFLLSLFTISLIAFFSCSEKSTEPEDTGFPEGVSEFGSAEEVALFVEDNISDIGSIVESSKEHLGKLSATDEDTVYYTNASGWWHHVGSDGYDSDSLSLYIEFHNLFQFKKDGNVQKAHTDADEMHMIVDIDGNSEFIFILYSMKSDFKEDFDLVYTNLHSSPLTVNGNGIQDHNLEITTPQQSRKVRYYLKYKLEDLQLPDEGYPTGKMTVETKRFVIEVVFNGTNIAHLTVKHDGTIVLERDIDLDEEDV